MENSESENSTMKCFSGILRRLLCTGSLPTHPSDQIIAEPDQKKPHRPNEDLKSEEAKADSFVSPPGIVARLMGLESLPDSNWVVSNNLKTPHSIERSRSVNSLDLLQEFDLKEAQHRRLRTSVSFREELPAFLQQQNGDYFVMRLKNAEEKTEMSKWEMCLQEQPQKSMKSKSGGPNLRKKEREVVEKKKESNQNEMKKKKIIRDEPRRVCSPENKAFSSSKTKENFSRQRLESKAESSLIARKQRRTTSDSKLVSQKKIKKKVEVVCSSENSTSPVSIPDHILEESGASNSSPGRKSSVKHANVDQREIKSRDPVQRKRDGNHDNEAIEFFLKALVEMRRLAEEDIKKAKWVSDKSSNYEAFEIICSELEQHVFDVVVYLVVDELANL
ncbi:DUF3741-associated sequence motif [Dillenia turbinata]|uniref:DUF3741-associated sequence motif n=1 Tax=Dillenia turbinata TaxID=194707 RepID=A0AAN8ZRM0_9MAGN